MKLQKSVFLGLLVFLTVSVKVSADQNEDFIIEDHESDNNEQNKDYENTQNGQRQMQYMSQRRTACLVLSRYYSNQFSQDINGIIKDLAAQDQSKFINKLYATAVEKCQPLITEMEVMQFFTQNNENFDPSNMFYIFDGYNFHQVTRDLNYMSPNQENIVKFIKHFDSQMEVKKQQQQAQKLSEDKDEGIQVFFVSLKNLPPQLKYLYIVIVLLISGVILWWGFSQLEKKPEKKPNKRRKKQ